MRIINFKIFSKFRNLCGINLAFNKHVNTYVLIGNNGAGKSSLLEAISSIFNAIFSGEEKKFEFCFSLVYEIEGRKVSIVKNQGKEACFKVDSQSMPMKDMNRYLPQRIICNYSGEEMRIRQRYYDPLWLSHERRLKSSSGNEVLRMVFVGKELWKVILVLIGAYQEMYESFKTFINDVLGVGKMTRIELDIDRDKLSRWVENPVSFYMRELASKIQSDGSIQLSDINPNGDSAFTVFNNISSAISLIKHIRIVFENGVDSDFLSEGEKKLMVILFILEVISNENSLVLLDEPDSHIHVARKPELVKMFNDSINRENILTTHSPTLTADFKPGSIIMLDRDENGCARVVDGEKQKVVTMLTNGKWSLQKQNIFLASNKDIMLVEGGTDEIFLAKALEVLKKAEKFCDQDFEFLPCGGASGVALLKDHFHPKAGQRMYCFFDSDKAGWEAISKIFDKEYKPEDFGLARKRGSIWVATYPPNKRVKGGFNIEDYFTRRVFLRHVLKFRSLNEIMGKEGIKKSIAQETEEGKIKEKEFMRFAPIFMLIDDMRKADSAGEDVLRCH